MNEYIDSRFKWDFIIRFCIGLVAISLLSALFFLLVIPKGEANVYVSLVYLLHRTEASLVPVILAVGLFEIVLALLFTLFLSLFLSHRVGGAVFKLECHLERLSRGDITSQAMNLRGTDQGQMLAVKFNEMLRVWQASFKELRYYCGKFSVRISGLKKEPLPEGVCSSTTMTRMKDDVAKMQAVLDRFIL